MFNRRRKISAEETAANAARKAARNAASMHCQCCGRMILANTGVIAHHGYQRPSEGWQTSSCYGARHLPFEVSRDVLGMWIESLNRRLANEVASRAAAEAETIPFSYSYGANKRDYASRTIYQDVSFTRETFNEARAYHSPGFDRALYGDQYSFDWHKSRDLANRDGSIQRLTSYIKDCQSRYDGWTQTHSWDAINEVWKTV